MCEKRGKIRERLLQDLVGLVQFPVLTLQRFDPGFLLRGQTIAFASVPRGLNAPRAQRVRGSRQSRGRLRYRSLNQGDARGKDEHRGRGTRLCISGDSLLLHGAHPLRVLPSGKPGAVQEDDDTHMCKWRHLIENDFAKIKEFRGMATRYDKADTSYAANWPLSAMLIAAR